MKEGLTPNVDKYLRFQRGARADFLTPEGRKWCKKQSQDLFDKEFSPEDHQVLQEHGKKKTEEILRSRVIFEAKGVKF